jgi:ABC-type uncharacterized transport system ATPase subunit
MANEVVRLEDVWVYFDGTAILEGVNLSVESGDFRVSSDPMAAVRLRCLR